MGKKTEDLPTLETSLSEITKLIEGMEHGELSLEQSLSHFERGVTLVKHCQKILDNAEQKVNILMQKDNKDNLAPYGDDEDASNK